MAEKLDPALIEAVTRRLLALSAGESPLMSALWASFWVDRGRQHRSARDTQARWRQLCAYRFPDGRSIEDMRAAELDASFPATYRTWRAGHTTRLDGPPAIGTVNRELERLRAVFNHAVKTGRLPAHPLQHIAMQAENNIRETRIGSEAEFSSLLVAARDVHTYMPALVLMYMDGGLRRLEGMRAKWVDLEFKPGGGARLRLTRTKNGVARWAHLTKRTADELKKLPRVSEWVFANSHVYRTGRKARRYGMPMGARYLTALFERAVEASGLQPAEGESITLHTLRHSFAYRARRLWKWPEVVIMRQGGWRTRSAFDRYGIADDAEVEEAMELAEREIRRSRKR